MDSNWFMHKDGSVKKYDSVDKFPVKCVGFVYRITNTENGHDYIGRKFFWTIKKRPPLKGKKNKRRSTVETDWKTYYGSQKEILHLVKEGDSFDFKREILKYVTDKKQLTYFECKYLFINEVLETRNSYINDNILGKFYRKDFLDEIK